MKKQQRKRWTDKELIPINTRLTEDVINRWHVFAAQNKLTKEGGLAEIINRGTKQERKK